MTTVQQAIHHFISHCKHEKNLSAKTIKFYSLDLRQFTSFIGAKNDSDIRRISKIELRRFLESLSHHKPKTIKRKMATIKALFNFLEFDDVIAINPVRKIKMRIKEPKKLPTVLGITEIEKMLRLLHQKRNTYTNDKVYRFKECVRNIAVIELLFATGGRVSEVAKLKLHDLDMTTGVVMIRGKGNRERIIQICNGETLSFLKYYKRVWNLQNRDLNDFLLINRFGRNLSEQSIRNFIKAISKEAGISKRITPHVFRHSFATLLLEEDVDIKYIQSLLGHSSIVTTQIYTHVSKAKQKQLLTMKHPRKDIRLPEFYDRIQDN